MPLLKVMPFIMIRGGDWRFIMNYELELSYAQDFVLESALRFLTGQPWVMSKTVQRLCDADGLDPDLLELAMAVLFGPAVVHVATGRSV
jgi:hypothetical protein